MPLRLAGVAVGVLVLTAVPAARADDARKELEKLQGKWEVTEVVFDGTATDNLKGVQAVFDKDKLSLIGKEGKREFRFKLDPTKKPKAIDMTALDGDLKDKINPAIYQLEGDLFKLCMSNEPGEQPEADWAYLNGGLKTAVDDDETIQVMPTTGGTP